MLYTLITNKNFSYITCSLKKTKGHTQCGGINVFLSLFFTLHIPQMSTQQLPPCPRNCLPPGCRSISTVTASMGWNTSKLLHHMTLFLGYYNLQYTFHTEWCLIYGPFYIYIVYINIYVYTHEILSSDRPNNLSMMSVIMFSFSKQVVWNAFT